MSEGNGNPVQNREAWFRAVVDLSWRYRALVLVVVALMTIVGGLGATQVRILTSRYNMVSAKDPSQVRLDNFFARFGYPDAMVFVVQGADLETRRAAVRELETELLGVRELEDRVLARVTQKTLAPLAFLHRPSALKQLRDGLGGNADIAQTMERGIPAWLDAVAAKIESNLDGVAAGSDSELGEPGNAPSEDPAPPPDPAVVSPAGAPPALGAAAPPLDQLDASMADLCRLADGLDRALAQDLSDADLGDIFAPQQEGDSLKSESTDEDGYLVSRKGEHLLVAVFPRTESSEVAAYSELIGVLRVAQTQVLDRHKGSGLEIWITGLPVLAADETALVSLGMMQSGIATAIGVLLVLIVAWRSLRDPIVALLPMGVTMAVAGGLVYAVVGSLNAITSAMFAILLGLGIDFGVHVVARFHEDLRRGMSAGAAIRESAVFTGPGLVTGAVTTILAFLSLATAQFTAFADLGIITALGLLVALVATFLVTPILVRLVPLKYKAPPTLLLMTRLAPVLRSVGPALLVLGAVAAVGGALMFSTIAYNKRYFDFLPQDLDSTKALTLLEEDGAMSPVLAYVVAEDLEDARAKTKSLREFDAVAKVESPTDLLPALDTSRLAELRAALAGLDRDPDFELLRGRGDRSALAVGTSAKKIVDLLDEVAFALDQAGKGSASVEAAKKAFVRLAATCGVPIGQGAQEGATSGKAEDVERRLGELEGRVADLLGPAWTTARRVSARGTYSLGDLPAIFRGRHEARDGSEAVAIMVFPARAVWKWEDAEAFASAVESVDPNAAGHALNMHTHNVMIVNDFLRAGALSAGLLLLVLGIDFRNPIRMLMAMTPLLIGGGWMLLVMGLVSVPFDLANIVVLPLLLGIGIDAGVHLVHRQQQSAAESPDGVAKLEVVLEGTGTAVLVSALTTMVGFAGLLLPDHGGMNSLGLVMVIGVGSSLLASLTILPALMLLTRQAR